MAQETSVAKSAVEAKAPPRERLLKAADELFERHGIRGVGVEAIAEAADTNKMTLYRHFSSKDELVAEWLRGLVSDWTIVWDNVEATRGQDSRDRLEFFLQSFGETFGALCGRGCPMMNSLAELKEKDHPARRVLDEHKAKSRARMVQFFSEIGIAQPDEAADEFTLLLDGAKAGVEDLGPARTCERFMHLTRSLLETRMADG